MSWRPVTWVLDCAGYRAVVEELHDGRFHWRVTRGGVLREALADSLPTAMLDSGTALTDLCRNEGET